MDKSFYTPQELADLLQVHVNTIYNMTRSGEITYYKVGAQKRIPASEVERLKVERKKSS